MSHQNFTTGKPCNCGFGKHQPPYSKFYTDLKQHKRHKALHNLRWGFPQKRAAVDPTWLQQYMEKHGPYLYHGTTKEAAKSILNEGLYPHDDGRLTANDTPLKCHNCGFSTPLWGKYHDEDPCPQCGDDYLSAPDGASEYSDTFYEPRPNHTYLGTQDYINRMGYGKRDSTPLRIDLRKLDPRNFNADEDHWHGVEVNRNHPAVQSVFEHDPPPDNSSYGDNDMTLGDWADQAQLGQDPAETHYSMEQGSIAHHGVIPPEAISQVPQTGGTFASWNLPGSQERSSKTDSHHWESKMFHGSESGLLGAVKTPFLMSSEKDPESPVHHPVSVRFKNPAYYFGVMDPELAIAQAQMAGNDGIVYHAPDQTQQAIAIDAGTVVPGHEHEFALL